MKFLELKIPPVLLVAMFAALMFGVSKISPTLGLGDSLRLYSFSITTVLAVTIALSGVWCFKVANTTVNPTKPESSSNLVQSGIYQYTRNPMYLGFAFFLFGLGLFLDNIFSVFLVLAFIGYMTEFQIKPEEQALSKIFGKQFQNYKTNTRRWL